MISASPPPSLPPPPSPPSLPPTPLGGKGRLSARILPPRDNKVKGRPAPLQDIQGKNQQSFIYCAGILEQSMGARNRVVVPARQPMWPVRQPYSYSVPSLHRLF